ncbi:MAG: DMT family transporter [Chthoniobacter sp.]|uniref:DMT family transporter n=1 Tax=Chthoniobacter sp. TaxID=2510640 RepID=UPI0032AD2E5E
MPQFRLVLLTSITMIAFAGNSLLCRLALQHTTIDAATFTTVRLLSGALTLFVVTALHRHDRPNGGNWLSALALFVYAAAFSFAYLSLPAGTGALLLFCAVQTTMIGHGIATGERLHRWQLAGLFLALGGMVWLFLPGVVAPPFVGSVLMISAGIAWGIYSLRGKGRGDPTLVTAGNFLRAVPIAVGVSVWLYRQASFDRHGLSYAIASGALTSALGYVCWYTVLPSVSATKAATVQLSVPIIAALGGIAFLHEAFTLHLALAALAILGGIALVVLMKPKAGVAGDGAEHSPKAEH